MSIEEQQILKKVVIKFAGDSGDGVQLIGQQFTNNSAMMGMDIATFPDFPAEIRAPHGTLPGVSGFQLQFSSLEVYTPGDECDVLVVMNAASLKTNLPCLNKGGIIIANIDGFDNKNLRLAKYINEVNPLEDGSLEAYHVIKIDVTKLTMACLKEDISLSMKDKDRAKNMFVLGFIYWMYHRDMDNTIRFLKDKFAHAPILLNTNVKVLQAGYHYGDITEVILPRYFVAKAKMSPGVYRHIIGNQALVLGLLTASEKTKLPIFLGSYPITPASEILHELSKYKHLGVKTFQAEDEIAAISSAIGASYAGGLGVTTTSGPGMALKTEAIGLAVMLEMPLLICNIQRGGPSTGLPTKTEQSDLLQAYYGRNGECPLPIIAASTSSSCFDCIIEAVRIAVRYMTPVIFLSDGYIANGAEPWKVPDIDKIESIPVTFVPVREEGDTPFYPYQRDERGVRPWAIPGTKGLEHRIGGLEKQDITGNVSYDANNHHRMVMLRAEKVNNIVATIPLQTVEIGQSSGKVLVLGWGSTYGVIKQSVLHLQERGFSISHAHITYMRPFPSNLKEILTSFEIVVIPEINNGQLIKIIREQYLIDAKGFNRVKGIPIQEKELVEELMKWV